MTSQFGSIKDNPFKVKTASPSINSSVSNNKFKSSDKLTSNKFLNNDTATGGKSGLKSASADKPKPKVLAGNSRIQSLISKLADNNNKYEPPVKKFVTKDKDEASKPAFLRKPKKNEEDAKKTNEDNVPKKLTEEIVKEDQTVIDEKDVQEKEETKSFNTDITVKESLNREITTKYSSPPREISSKESSPKPETNEEPVDPYSRSHYGSYGSKTKEASPEPVKEASPIKEDPYSRSYYGSYGRETKEASPEPVKEASPIKEDPYSRSYYGSYDTKTKEVSPEPVKEASPIKEDPYSRSYYGSYYGSKTKEASPEPVKEASPVKEDPYSRSYYGSYDTKTKEASPEPVKEASPIKEDPYSRSYSGSYYGSKTKEASPEPEKENSPVHESTPPKTYTYYESIYTSKAKENSPEFKSNDYGVNKDLRKESISSYSADAEEISYEETTYTESLKEQTDAEEKDEIVQSTVYKDYNLTIKTETHPTSELEEYRMKLAESENSNKQLKTENRTLHAELQDIRHEMEELQDQFRLDDADEFRQLQAELEIAAKNCRILQFKLRKIEKRNENLENDKLLLQDKLEDSNRDSGKVTDLEEELLIAKEVSIRLHSELEQAQDWRNKSETLNKELKKQLDELKDHLDNEIKNRVVPSDNTELVLVNGLYESMFREYFMQEQLYSMSNNSQSENITKQLREVTDLLSTYQQKITIYNDEIGILKHQITSKDREMDSMRLQLKNLKRGRSTDRDYGRRHVTSYNDHADDEDNTERKVRSSSVELTDTISRQNEINNDEVKLLKNKIARLEDDLSYVTQERDNLSSQLDSIENKAMKSFATIVENDIVAIDADEEDIESDNSVINQMNELKKKIDQLKNEAKQNELSKIELSSELKGLKTKLNNTISDSKTALKQEQFDIEFKNTKLDKQEIETIKNLTDADKLLRDENMLLKTDLQEKATEIDNLNSEMSRNVMLIGQLRGLISAKDAQLEGIASKETTIHQKLDEASSKVNQLTKQIEINETNLEALKSEINEKNKIEKSLVDENDTLNGKITEFSVNLQEKTLEITDLNNQNKHLQESQGNNEKKMQTLDEDLTFHKSQITSLNKDLAAKNAELQKLESLINKNESTLSSVSSKGDIVKSKLKECVEDRNDLVELQQKFENLTVESDSKISSLSSEIDRLSSEKEKLTEAFESLTTLHNNCSKISENEVQSEKVVLKKLETEVLNAKYESKVQYLEIEIDTLRSKIRKLLKEKEVQDHITRENQLLVKEIALKYTTDSDNWSRQRAKLLEKEKLYEESVDMRKELKKAADKLRQKLQSLEEQIIDKQNKHTIEKNGWETQRIQYISSLNKYEEQLAKMPANKKSKKEVEASWEKERNELSTHITNLEVFIKDLQSQLSQRNQTSIQSNDQYGQNEKIQSLFGENEFLKNRIKELEVMLEEMEQVKRFLFDVKEAYDTDKLEWNLSKEEFRYQLELKENLWIESNMRLNQIVEVIQAIQSKKALPENLAKLAKENAGESNGESNEINLLNSLVGSTSNLLEQKFTSSQRSMAFKEMGIRHNSMQNHLLENQYNRNLSPSKLNISNLKPINEQQNQLSNGEDADVNFIDTTRERKELNSEFDRAFKKMNRVKDNYSTHKKFMDIVKSKSMKALNRKSSTTSLASSQAYDSKNELFPLNVPHESRGSVPPDHRIGSMTTPRAKSMSKEPYLARENSTSSQKSNSSMFHSLSRRIAKFRSSSTQPRNDKNYSIDDPDYPSTQDLSYERENKSMSRQVSQDRHNFEPSASQADTEAKNTEKFSKEDSKERTLSPKKILKGLRARSPFARKNNSNTDLQKSSTPNLTATTMISGGKNKSFTVGSSEPVSGNSRLARATTAVPTSKSNFGGIAQSLKNDKVQTRSASCEFIDNHQQQSLGTQALNKLNETVDEDDESIYDASSHTQPLDNIEEETNNRSRRVIGMSSFNTSQSSQISNVSKMDKANRNYDTVSNSSHDIVKSVKFKEPDVYNLSNSATASPASKTSSLKNQEMKLLEVLDKAMVSTPGSTLEKNNSKTLPLDKKISPNQKFKSAFNLGGSNTSVDKPPKPPAQNLTNAFGLRSKLSGIRSRTMDAYDSHKSHEPENGANTNQSVENLSQSSNTPILNAAGKPIQSILRRSETPPVGKSLKSQASLDSHRSYREESIEKILNASSSTSRPLMFKEK